MCVCVCVKVEGLHAVWLTITPMSADLSAVVLVVLPVPPLLQVAVGGRFERLVGPVHGSAATAVCLCVFKLEEVVATETYRSLLPCSRIMFPLIMT